MSQQKIMPYQQATKLPKRSKNLWKNEVLAPLASEFETYVEQRPSNLRAAARRPLRVLQHWCGKKNLNMATLSIEDAERFRAEVLKDTTRERMDLSNLRLIYRIHEAQTGHPQPFLPNYGDRADTRRSLPKTALRDFVKRTSRSRHAEISGRTLVAKVERWALSKKIDPMTLTQKQARRLADDLWQLEKHRAAAEALYQMQLLALKRAYALIEEETGLPQPFTWVEPRKTTAVNLLATLPNVLIQTLENRPEGSRRMSKRAMRHLLKWAEREHVDLTTLTHEQVQAFTDTLEQQQLSPNSQARILSELRKVYALYINRKGRKIKVNPFVQDDSTE